MIGQWNLMRMHFLNPSVEVEYHNGKTGVLFKFNPWHYHAYEDGLPEKSQPFLFEEMVGLTAAQARAMSGPDSPRSYHEQTLREAVDEWKQLKANKNRSWIYEVDSSR